MVTADGFTVADVRLAGLHVPEHNGVVEGVAGSVTSFVRKLFQMVQGECDSVVGFVAGENVWGCSSPQFPRHRHTDTLVVTNTLSARPARGGVGVLSHSWCLRALVVRRWCRVRATPNTHTSSCFRLGCFSWLFIFSVHPFGCCSWQSKCSIRWTYFRNVPSAR